MAASFSADANENADLFWAVRGGGGNFGVVTATRFSPASQSATSSRAISNIRFARPATCCGFSINIAPTIPDELFILAAVLPFPGERMLDLAVVWNGDEHAGRARAASVAQLHEAVRGFDQIEALHRRAASGFGFALGRRLFELSTRRPYGTPRCECHRRHRRVRCLGAERIERHHDDVLARPVVFASAQQRIRLSARRLRILGAFVLAGGRRARGLDSMGARNSSPRSSRIRPAPSTSTIWKMKASIARVQPMAPTTRASPRSSANTIRRISFASIRTSSLSASFRGASRVAVIWEACR